MDGKKGEFAGGFGGVLGKVVCRTWCFGGEFVVDCVVNAVC